ncbi:hypothetical protein OE903_15445 [Bacillus sp. B6(2022)]|nr:hypothetical protein [Bacillus sp. B6(2022)]
MKKYFLIITSLFMLIGLPVQTFATSSHPVSSLSKTAPEEYPVLKKQNDRNK